MIPNRSQFGGTGPAAHESGLSQPELREEMEKTFLKLCDLLEQYAPSWYSARLHEEAESVLLQIGH
jgi:hypothetical protein